MKKLITAIVLFFISMLAIAQYFELDLHLQCDSTETMLTGLTVKYNEQPIWRGVINESAQAMLLANPETMTWSIILVNIDSPSKACLVTNGTGFSTRSPTKRSSI